MFAQSLLITSGDWAFFVTFFQEQIMKIVIIGAGISGAIAAGALSSYNPKIFDAAKKKVQNHRAVMRLRDSSVCMYLGVGYRKVKVHKAISFEGKLKSAPNIKMNNLYSMKTNGTLSDRSISNLGSADRFIMTQPYSIKDVAYDKWLVGVSKNALSFADGTTETFDACISTIPMPIMLIAAGIGDASDLFEYKNIFVYRGKLNIKSSINQTLYFPSDAFHIYRATIQSQDIIIESVSEINPEEIAGAMKCFGIKPPHYDISVAKVYKQEMGKMLPINEHRRKWSIITLTDTFNIYSFGRFAIWKPIRTDHLVSDIENIKAMITDDSKYFAHKIAINKP